MPNPVFMQSVIKYTRIRAFRSVQIISKLLCGAYGPADGKLYPVPKPRFFGYASGGSFSKTVRCLPAAFVLFAVILITACGSSNPETGNNNTGNNPDPSSDVSKTDIKAYTLEYKSGTYSNKTEYALKPAQNGIPANAGAVYTLTSDPTNDNITINPTDGAITIARGTAPGSYRLTVTAAADNTNYTGSKTSPEFTVTVNDKKQDINIYSLSYGTGTPQINTGGEIELTTDIPTSAQVTYSFDNPPPAGFSINGTTGKITTAATVAEGIYTFTVTAGVPVTSANYTGTKSVTVSVEVTNTVSYKPDTEQAASKGFFTAGDIDTPALVSLTSVTDSTTVSDQKIVIKAGGNTIFDITADINKGPGGTVTLGIPAGKITHANFKAITDGATIDITVSAKVDGVGITKTIVKTKTPFTDIYSWRDLDKVRKDLSADYTLKNDIRFPAYNTYGYGTGFDPIGDESHRFTGSFDGNSKTISRLVIVSTKKHVGLFGFISGNKAVIKNFVILYTKILSKFNSQGNGESFAGAVGGQIENGVKIINVGVRRNDSVPDKNDLDSGIVGTRYPSLGVSGGLVGKASGPGIQITGYMSGVVSGLGAVGGLVGEIEGRTDDKGIVTGYMFGIFNGNVDVGGLVGKAVNSTVTGYMFGDGVSFTTGNNVTYYTGHGKGKYNVGGLVGKSVNSTVTGYLTGDLSGREYIGGLVGRADAGSRVVGYARGRVAQNGAGANDFETKNRFGEFVGYADSSDQISGYYSSTESQLLTVIRGVEFLNSNELGQKVHMHADTSKKAFSKLSFGTEIGKWVWIENGRWPAIVIDENKTDAGTIGQLAETKRGGKISECETNAPEKINGIYEIKEEKHLEWMRTCATQTVETYKLMNDISLTKNWTPIGTPKSPFTGKFDGNGKTISGLVIDDRFESYLGFFGYIYGAEAEVKNGVISYKGIEGSSYLGVLAGYAGGGAKITGVGVKNESAGNNLSGINGNCYCGGLVGKAEGAGTIIMGYSIGTDIGGGGFIGGLVGEAVNSTVIGFSTGKFVKGSGVIGGLVGHAVDSTVTGYSDLYLRAIINAGGLVGLSKNSTVTGYAKNRVIRNGSNFLSFGKLVGNNEQSTITGYHSATKSRLLEKDETTDITGTTGINGVEVTMAPGITKSAFGYFTFSDATGDWNQETNGKWPAINIGTIKPAADQPTAP